MRLTWKQVCEARPLEMRALLSFMERCRPGSTRALRPATSAQIAALAEPLSGGIEALPRVYVEFLQAMGEHTADLRLAWGDTSASTLLAERAERGSSSHEPSRLFKFAIGDDGDGGRSPDDFLDLARIRSDGSDAPVVQMREGEIVTGQPAPREPFASFSDLVRSCVCSQFVLHAADVQRTLSVYLGDGADAPERAYEFLTGLGFEPNELGASPGVMILEDVQHGALASVTGPSRPNPGTLAMVRLPVGNQGLHLKEMLIDYRDRALGRA